MTRVSTRRFRRRPSNAVSAASPRRRPRQRRVPRCARWVPRDTARCRRRKKWSRPRGGSLTSRWVVAGMVRSFRPRGMICSNCLCRLSVRWGRCIAPCFVGVRVRCVPTSLSGLAPTHPRGVGDRVKGESVARYRRGNGQSVVSLCSRDPGCGNSCDKRVSEVAWTHWSGGCLTVGCSLRRDFRAGRARVVYGSGEAV